MKEEFSKMVRHDDISCPECDKKLVEDTDRGERFCGSCGYVSPDRLVESHGAVSQIVDEARFANKGHSPAAAPFGKSGMIGSANKDFSGKSISPQIKQIMDRLRIWDNRAGMSTPGDRNLKEAVPLIDSWCVALGIHESAKNRATTIYAKAVKENLVRGRSIRQIAIGSILVSCRIDQIPRTAEQLSEVSKIPRKAILRSAALLRTNLDLTGFAQSTIGFLPMIIDKLKLPEQVSREAGKLIDRAVSQNLWDGREPMNLVCAAVYITSLDAGINITQKQLHEASGKSEVAIRAALRTINQEFNLDFRDSTSPKVKVRR